MHRQRHWTILICSLGQAQAPRRPRVLDQQPIKLKTAGISTTSDWAGLAISSIQVSGWGARRLVKPLMRPVWLLTLWVSISLQPQAQSTSTRHLKSKYSAPLSTATETKAGARI